MNKLLSPIFPLASFTLLFLTFSIVMGQLFSFIVFVGYWLCMFYEIKCEVDLAEYKRLMKAAQWQYDQHGAIIWSQLEYFGKAK